jgi:hypothetical protein
VGGSMYSSIFAVAMFPSRSTGALMTLIGNGGFAVFISTTMPL